MVTLLTLRPYLLTYLIFNLNTQHDIIDERKGKKEVYLYSAFIVATNTLKALRRGSHSFTYK